MEGRDDNQDEIINNSLVSYAKLLKYDNLKPLEEDKLDTIYLTAKIGDLFNNSNVDYIVTPVKVKSNKIILNDDKFKYIKEVSTETLSCNRFSIKFLCDMLNKPEFHLSSLSKDDDTETYIFTVLKHKKRNIILFDKSFLDTKHNLRFKITESVITQTGVEVQFDYMNWSYEMTDFEYC